MSLSVDEDTRVITNKGTEKYLEQKSKRALLKRIKVLEDAVELMQNQIEVLMTSRENRD